MQRYSGTLGALMRDEENGHLYALSNNHVFGDCNHMPIGMPIMSPSNKDAGPQLPAPREIARFLRMHELRSGNPFLVRAVNVDAALGEVTDEDVVSSWQGNEHDGYDTPTTIVEPYPGMRVKKFGRTTGLTKGTIRTFVRDPMAVPYQSTHFWATVWFRHVWAVAADEGEMFAAAGDSGSLVVTEDGAAAVGLIFAASPNGVFGWISPLTDVVAKLKGIALVGNHGV